MGKMSRIVVLSSYVALVCTGTSIVAGCADQEHSSASITIAVRFLDGSASTQPSSGIVLRTASRPVGSTSAAAGPITHDQVTRILVDINYADTGDPYLTSFALIEPTPDRWQGTVPHLPLGRPLHFAARALDAAGELAFSGETFATLGGDGQTLDIPLAPVQDGYTFQVPQLSRIAYPTEMFSGDEAQFAFSIQSNAGTMIDVRITAAGSTTPAAEFHPATGTVTLASTAADFVPVYTAPEVATDTVFDYQVTITDARVQGAVAVITDFPITIKPRPPGQPSVFDTNLSVLLNPVILSLTARGGEIPGTVDLLADVSDDSPPNRVTYRWSYVAEVGAASFANNQVNPAQLQDYTPDDQGTITLAVTDEHGGTTTLHYRTGPGQFAGTIDHGPADGLQRIVAGSAHTCVLTGDGRVRCWGDNRFGQLGYGNTIDLGDTPATLPYTAGDVPLPAADPVMQLVAGNNHTCALLRSGNVYCWGDNQFGQLGYGRTDDLGDGEPVTSFGVVLLRELVIRIAAGGDDTCAILQSGALICWGRNDFGQLGRGNTANLGDNEALSDTASIDLGAGVTVKDVALGSFHTCALLATGAVRCWGRNDAGQLGYGHTENLGDDEPVNNLPDVALTGAVRKLVAGEAHTCALTFAGTLRCWGANGFGQLGQNIGANDAWGDQAGELPSTLPGDIATGAPVSDVTAGVDHTCALSSDGQLKCWGRGDSGQLGYGNFDNLAAPPTAGVDLGGDTAYAIAAGAAHTCALRSNGTARCWGAGGSGRLGRGSTATTATATGDADIQIFAFLTVGGTVSGLAGSGLVLRDNGGDDLAVSADGTFTFPTALRERSAYAVTVQTQPTNRSQSCTVSNGSGTLARANITNVAVMCVTNRYTIGGTVTGLAGTGLVLRNGSDSLAVSANGTFAFAAPLADLSPYAVTVQTQPTGPSQTCTVSNGSGNVAGANATNVAVSCVTSTFSVGGSVSGLGSGQSVVLQNNGGNNLTVSANGGFTFTAPIASGSIYNVTVATTPLGGTCTVSNGSGMVTTSAITNVAVTCTPITFTIGGNVSGLGGGQSVMLQNNGTNNLTVSVNGGFTFTTAIASGSTYNVTVATPPPGELCTVSNGSGTVAASNVTNVTVNCFSASVATVKFQITNFSASTITLDTASCSPGTSIFPPFSISPGNTVSFSATTTTSSFLSCTVKYQDQTGVQGCLFQVVQDTGSGSSVGAGGYKGSNSHSPSCTETEPPIGTGDPTAQLGIFTMQAH